MILRCWAAQVGRVGCTLEHPDDGFDSRAVHSNRKMHGKRSTIELPAAFGRRTGFELASLPYAHAEIRTRAHRLGGGRSTRLSYEGWCQPIVHARLTGPRMPMDLQVEVDLTGVEPVS